MQDMIAPSTRLQLIIEQIDEPELHKYAAWSEEYDIVFSNQDFEGRTVSEDEESI